MGCRPVRIGVLVDGQHVHGWEFAILRRLADNPRFDLVASIENTATVARGPRLRLRRDWGSLPWGVLDKLDAKLARRLFGGKTEFDPDESIDLARLPGATPMQMKVAPEVSSSGLVHRFPAGAISALRSLDLDVMLRFGFNILRGEVLNVARFGVWSFHHADNKVNRGMPAGFWEVASGEEYTGAILQVLTDDLDNGPVLREATYATVRSSWNENRRRIYWKSGVLMLDALAELARTRRLPAATTHDLRPLRLYDRPLFTKPRPKVVATTAARLAWLAVTSRLSGGLSLLEWRILVARGDLRGQSLRRLKELTPPAGTFWGDPFVVDFNGVSQLYFEDFDNATQKGTISTGRLTEYGIEDVQGALDMPYHLSYPHVFVHCGRLFMVPESHQSGNIELWECTEFPAGWTKLRNLLDLPAVDSTLVFRDGLWWMFTSIDRSGYRDFGDELNVYMTDDLLTGDFRPHPANPVVTDTRRARMGGAFVTTADGKLLRMAQRGGQLYGGGLKILRVDELTTTTYAETEVEAVGPHWRPDAVGVHHCCIGSTYSVMDVCIKRRRAFLGMGAAS